MNVFARSDHVYVSPDLDEVIKDTIRFLNGTPVHSIPTPERFHGTGVYALYCIRSLLHCQIWNLFKVPFGKLMPFWFNLIEFQAVSIVNTSCPRRAFHCGNCFFNVSKEAQRRSSRGSASADTVNGC